MNLFETSRQVTVLGAGMGGVSCALALQAKGWRVSLVDQRQRGRAFAQFFVAIQSTWFVAKPALDVAQAWTSFEDPCQCNGPVAVALALCLACQTFFV